MIGAAKPNVLVVGAGAIGLSVAGWIFPYNENLHLLARGESVDEIKRNGLCLHQIGQEPKVVRIPVVKSLDEISVPDVIVIAVKNYDLDRAAFALRQELKNVEPIVVTLQNGVDNQQILPKYFSKALFGVVCYNAWREGPGKVAYVKHGHLLIGTPTNDLQQELKSARGVFNSGLDCFITDRLEDAVHCKLAINLINGLMALVGFRKRSIESEKILVHMTTRLLWEGVQVLQAAGFKEQELGSMPSWSEIQMAVNIPESRANPLYDFIVNRVGPTSMTQDVFAGKKTTELDSLNGHMLELAQRVRVPMPINRAIYEIAKERFCPGFEPIQEIDLWEMINERILDSTKMLTRTLAA
ncbi:MAG: 2-dehydropantoate 2-reductase [Candidatus Bathyarchaeia archaeon]|jgi:2-dehydropantoate 2-reductase